MLSEFKRCLEDYSITFIDKNDVPDPTRREGYWRRVLKTIWIEYDRLIVLFGQITSSNEYL